MRTLIKIGYSENTKAVLAETKLEVETENVAELNDLDFNKIQQKAKDIFEDAQNYALKQTLRRM